ncbi:hypothetical protein Tco_1000703 [Tanacetum coccineum]
MFHLNHLFHLLFLKVPDTNDTIKFKLNSQEIVYTVDMFRYTLNLLVETTENPFIEPATIKVIESFMQRVGYQGVVDKVSAFYTKFPAQPWQTMFKVFNRCLTTRTSGHDQIKINILQLFHVVVNRGHADYAALLWWDFLNYVFQKKDVIQYPRFTKLIISDLMKKNVLFRGMLIPDAFLTNEIHATDDYAEYETVFVKNKKRKQIAREISSPRKPLKVTIRQKKQRTTPIPPLGNDREKDEMAKATLLSLTLHKTALVAKAQENIAKVQEKLEEEEIEKMVEGEENEESYASIKVDKVLHEIIPHIAEKTTNDVIEGNLKRIVADTIIQERDALQAEMKSNPQDQSTHPALWDVLKCTFEKSSTSTTSCRDDAFRPHHHDDHQDDDAPPEEEKRAVNLTAPTLTFPGIEVHDPYYIVDKPSTGLIYLNRKEKKRVIYLAEIVKFWDATLERVLNEVKLKIFKFEPWKKPPLLGELNLDILKACEREITKRLRHRVQMRKWESDTIQKHLFEGTGLFKINKICHGVSSERK